MRKTLNKHAVALYAQECVQKVSKSVRSLDVQASSSRQSAFGRHEMVQKLGYMGDTK